MDAPPLKVGAGRRTAVKYREHNITYNFTDEGQIQVRKTVFYYSKRNGSDKLNSGLNIVVGREAQSECATTWTY